MQLTHAWSVALVLGAVVLALAHVSLAEPAISSHEGVVTFKGMRDSPLSSP
jgi:uncharacterized membrane protein HdeD (DUF308 family)